MRMIVVISGLVGCTPEGAPDQGTLDVDQTNLGSSGDGGYGTVSSSSGMANDGEPLITNAFFDGSIEGNPVWSEATQVYWEEDNTVLTLIGPSDFGIVMAVVGFDEPYGGLGQASNNVNWLLGCFDTPAGIFYDGPPTSMATEVDRRSSSTVEATMNYTDTVSDSVFVLTFDAIW